MRKWMRVWGICLLQAGILLARAGPASGQPAAVVTARNRAAGRFVVSTSAALEIPIAESRDYYTAGAGCELSGTYSWFPPLDLRAVLAYGYSPLVTSRGLSWLCATAGVGIRFVPVSRLTLSAFGAAGWGSGWVRYLEEIKSGGSLSWMLGTGVGFQASPALEFGLGAGLKGISGLYSGVGLSLSGAYRFKPRAAARGAVHAWPSPASSPWLLMNEPELEVLFPVLYRHYRQHPFGSLQLRNSGSIRVEVSRVTVFVSGYMQAPSDCAAGLFLDPGEAKEIPLTGAFDERMLQITAPTTLRAELKVEYSGAGRRREESRMDPLQVWDRNALSWDDPPKAAAFITFEDPLVVGLSRAAQAVAQKEAMPGVNGKLLAAMAMYYALDQLGIRLAEEQGSAGAVDSLQFPRETLEKRSGDRAELAVLYCALLESAGLESALILAAGEVLPALCLGGSEAEALGVARTPDELIAAGGKIWLPVKLGGVRLRFLEAWMQGADGWRESSAGNEAQLLPVREAWRSYEAVQLPGAATESLRLDERRLASWLHSEQLRFLNRGAELPKSSPAPGLLR